MFGLDVLELEGEPIVITAPGDLEVITTSFVQGFFAASLRALGEEGLMKRYDFSKLPSFLRDDLKAGIDRLKLHDAQASRARGAQTH